MHTEKTFDTETTRRLLALNSLQDVRNLTRPGKLLDGAQVRRGSYNTRKVLYARAKIIRRDLAQKLGRSSPRFLPESHSRKCLTCDGAAVEWHGRILCEQGHLQEQRPALVENAGM